MNRVFWNVKDKMPISKFKMNSVERFVGVVVKVMPSRYVKKRETRVASIEIADETGSLVLSLWGTKADSHGLLAGDVVFFRGVWIKSNTYNGRMQASLAREGYFRVLFKFHSKTWCSDADENIKRRAKRVLDGVSKRYPQLLRESQFTESSRQNNDVRSGKECNRVRSGGGPGRISAVGGRSDAVRGLGRLGHAAHASKK